VTVSGAVKLYGIASRRSDDVDVNGFFCFLLAVIQDKAASGPGSAAGALGGFVRP
jgi:hypothetical protein